MPGTISLFIATTHPLQTKNAYLGSSEEQGLNVKREKGDDREESSIS